MRQLFSEAVVSLSLRESNAGNSFLSDCDRLIILTIIAGLALYALQRTFDRGASPGPNSLSREAPQGEDPVAAAARAQREAAEAEAANRKTWAAAEERRRRDEEANAEFQRQQNALLCAGEVAGAPTTN
jgi:hypothetical protein